MANHLAVVRINHTITIDILEHQVAGSQFIGITRPAGITQFLKALGTIIDSLSLRDVTIAIHQVCFRTYHLVHAVTYNHVVGSLAFLQTAHEHRFIPVARIDFGTSLAIIEQAIIRQFHHRILIIGDVGTQCPTKILNLQDVGIDVDFDTPVAELTIVVSNGIPTAGRRQRHAGILVRSHTVVEGEAQREAVVQEAQIKADFGCTGLFPTQVRIGQSAQAETDSTIIHG